MRRMVMVVAMAIAATLPVGGLAAQEKPNKHERQLVAAELKEIGEGDLDGAMKAYAALHADAEAPKAVRARAALNLARCERKRGRLAVAERLLAALVRDFAQEKQVVKTAQSFLRELRTGKPENPDFDWMGALEKNPEIQARVFKLAMDVAEPGGSQGILARKQLQALGRVAVPMLLKLCATSREPVHRQVLATILVQAGSFERLDVLFGGAALAMDYDELPSMIEAVLRFEPEDKQRLLEAARTMKPHPSAAAWLAAVRLAAGEEALLEEVLKTLEGSENNPHLGWSSAKNDPCTILRDRARHKPALVEPMLVQRLKDSKCDEVSADTYLEILRGRVVKHLTLDQVTRLLIRVGSATDISSYAHEFFARWEKEGTYGPIVAMARHKKLHAEITKYLDKRYDWKVKPEAVPAGWAGVLRAGGFYADLHRIAERNDGFVPVFESFMRQRAKIAPKFGGHRSTTGFDDRLAIYGSWRPSTPYSEAMARLLTVDDPITRILALEALALAEPGVGPDTAGVTRKLIEASLDDEPGVAGAGIASLASRFPRRPETGPALVEVLLRLCRREHQTKRGDDAMYQYFPETLSSHPLGGRYRPKPLLCPPGPELLPFVLERTDSEFVLERTDSQFVRLLVRGLFWAMDSKQVTRAMTKALQTSTDPRRLNVLLSVPRSYYVEFAATDAGKRALKQCVLDRRLESSGRFEAFVTCWPGSATWIDWVGAMREDADLMCEVRKKCGGVIRDWLRKQPTDFLVKVVIAAAQSGSPVVRAWAIQELSLDLRSPPDQLALVEKAMGDPAEEVSHAVWYVLMVSPSARVAPLLVRLLTEPRFAWCLEGDYPKKTFRRIARLAPREAIPVLVTLLDHDSILVRTSALETLREIKKVLDEKAEWKRLVEELKKTSEKAVEKKG